MLGKSIPKKDTPMVDGDHPEEDTSEFLNEMQHQRYQMFIGMLNWIVCIGRIDIAFSTSSLSRFTASPCKGHYDCVLKKYKNKRIVVDSRVGGKDSLSND